MRAGRSSSPGTLVLRYTIAAAAIALGASLVWGLRSLIVPVAVAGLLAYICRPVVVHLERWLIPRSVAVVLLLLMFALVALVGVNSLQAAMPSEVEALELRVRALYSLHHHYRALMGLDASWTRGNRLYGLVHRDVDPWMDRLTEMLALTPEEHAQFVASQETRTGAAAARSNRVLAYDRSNVKSLEMRAHRTAPAEPATRTFAAPLAEARPSVEQRPPVSIGHVVSTWVIAPLVFLFLLLDTGDLKRGLLAALPNRLFEPALAVLADLDRAVGDYLRGIFLECCSLGLTVMIFIGIVGVPLRWAIAIGIVTGASNLVPYMGFAAALLSGLGYALLAEDVHPLLPLVTTETFAIWVVAAVVLAELLKNVVYEPIVLGGAVKLHPLAVVLGIIGGAILFGPVGMFLAIPTITVVKALVASTARHLTAHDLI
jgi:predicted PurR-regulated permease PerM